MYSYLNMFEGFRISDSLHTMRSYLPDFSWITSIFSNLVASPSKAPSTPIAPTRVKKGPQRLDKLISRAVLGRSAERVREERCYIDKYWKGTPERGVNRTVRKYFQAEERKVQTADGCSLDVLIVTPKKDAWDKLGKDSEKSRTVVYFNGRRQVRGLPRHEWMYQKAIHHQTPCQFVFFNYRGTGKSTGEIEQLTDLIEDGRTILDWVVNKKEGLGVDPKKVVGYGYSLGGPVGAQAMATAKGLEGEVSGGKRENRFLGERTFATFEHLAEAHLGTSLAKRLSKRIERIGKEINTKEAFEKLGNKLVVYEPKDGWIPDKASARFCVLEKDTMCLREKLSHKRETKQHHRSDLLHYRGARKAMALFLFGAEIGSDLI